MYKQKIWIYGGNFQQQEDNGNLLNPFLFGFQYKKNPHRKSMFCKFLVGRMKQKNQMQLIILPVFLVDWCLGSVGLTACVGDGASDEDPDASGGAEVGAGLGPCRGGKPGGTGNSSTATGRPALFCFTACSNCLIILPILRALLGFSSDLAFSSCFL